MLLGISGKKGSGKDTVGDYLVKEYGFTKDSFAKPLKNICKELFNFTDEQLYGNKKENIDFDINMSPRKVFQIIGTELFRKDLKKYIPTIENVWIKSLKCRLDMSKFNVICDVRFKDEVEFIKENGGYIIHIERDTCQKNNIYSDHESETQILHRDFIIQNNSTKDELILKLDLTLNLILNSVYYQRL